jgi:hypothetical protein
LCPAKYSELRGSADRILPYISRDGILLLLPRWVRFVLVSVICIPSIHLSLKSHLSPKKHNRPLSVRCQIHQRPKPLLLLFTALLLTAGGPHPAATADTPKDALNAFLDCRRCDFSYIRGEIPFVNWVRDREDAVVHILITDQRTGSGGRNYDLNFIGLRQNAGTDQTLSYVCPPDYTDDEEREGLTGILTIGLLPYLETPLLTRLTVSFDDDLEAAAAFPVDDSWDSWVFEIEGSGDIEKEASRTEISIDGSLSADRVTEVWRIRTWAAAEYDEDLFENDGKKTKSTSHEWRVWGMMARSLGPHWSVGISGRVYSETYDNTDLGLRLAPALEYSLWDYQENQRRSLTFAYRVGQRSVDYVEETILGETSETRFDQSLDIDLRLNQPWGSVRASLEGSHYFHDINRYRVELFSRLSVRLFRGLSLYFSGGVERINDQLSLPRGNATLEEILLQRRQLATDYTVDGRIGLSYTFGSIYNNVVNTRL